jgi:hypothetical protein
MSLTARRVRKSVLILACLALPSWGADAIVGCIKTTQGEAFVARGTQTIPASEGMHLLSNDILRTSASGRLGAILQDGTGIGLGPNTELKIDSFIYEPSSGNLSLVMRLARGVIAYFSGRIAKLAPGAVTVETPVGVIGLRGTHLAVSIEGTP